jgi:hypothetical protein
MFQKYKIEFQATVVCKQLGFSGGATSVQCCSAYGAVPTTFSYDEVGCTGTETTLDSCPHQNTHDCGTGEGAGVVCNTGTTGDKFQKTIVFLFLKRLMVPSSLYMQHYRKTI